MARRISNVGFVLAALLALTPALMRAYSTWAERRALAGFATMGALAPVAPPRPGPIPPNRRQRLARRAWEPCIIEIPSLGVRSVVRKGAGNWRLIPGAAYEPNSAGPGGAGNPIIAAHRNMWQQAFRDLPRLRAGQAVIIRTHTRRYEYVVKWAAIVSTRRTDLLRDTPDPRLTLYTCVLPFDPNRRYVVRAALVSQPASRMALARKADSAATKSQPRRSSG
ncbi:MAG TPA: sortase [Armatimonadota bacterium]|jgi:sortase A